jgi:putative pyoverdin transport system ATP-binding/permease protein
MKVIQTLIAKYWKLLILAMIGSALSGLSTSSIIHIINENVSKNFTDDSYGAGTFFGIIAFVFLTGVLSRFVLNKLGNHVIYELQMIMAGRILKTSYAQLEKIGVPRLYATFTEDIGAISATFSVLPTLVFSFFMVVGGFVYLAYLSSTYLLVVAGCIVIGLSASSFLMGISSRHMKNARERFDELFANFNHTVRGTKELKLNTYRKATFVNKSLNNATSQVRDQNIKASNTMALFDEWGSLLLYVIIGIIIFITAGIWKTSNEVLTGYVLTILFLAGPISAILDTIPILIAGKVSFDKLDNLKLSKDYDWTTISAPTSPPCDGSWKSLSLRNIHYHYNDPEADDDDEFRFHLGPINIEVEPSKVLFLVGGNGSGKTTLAKILTGLYRPDEGEITLDGQLITPENEEWYRNNFSAIFSDFHLFRELVDKEGGECDKELAQTYLEELRLDNKLSIKNSTLSTIDLSLGQKKRLALLSAYLEDKPIYLFDEWAADQDPIFKEFFYNHILNNLKAKNKGIIVISHDDRYFHLADSLLKLENGVMKEYEAI